MRNTGGCVCTGPSRRAARARACAFSIPVFFFLACGVWSATLFERVLDRVEIYFVVVVRETRCGEDCSVAHPFRPLEVAWEHAVDGNGT